MKDNKKGFTLIEMMIVIAIVAVLVSVIIPIVNGSTDKAAAATNAANLRSVEGELVAMMLADPEAFNASDKAIEQEEIDEEQADREAAAPVLEELEDAAKSAKEEMEAYEPTYNAARAAYEAAGGDPDSVEGVAWDTVSHPGCETDTCSGDVTNCSARCKAAREYSPVAVAYKGLGTVFSEAQTAFETAKNNNQTALGQLAEREGALYKYVAVDGWITLENGTKIEAPASKAVDMDKVTIEENVQMVVIVNTYDYTFSASYGVYDKNDFAAIAEE